MSLSASRKINPLSESLMQKLTWYAAGATAAGVGVLALAQPAEAKIVYTPAKIRLAYKVSIGLDLNHDGKKDFYFTDSGISAATFASWLLVAPALNGNSFVESSSNGQTKGAAALKAGVKVGSSQIMSIGGTMAQYCAVVGSGKCPKFFGPWGGKSGHDGVKDRYLGVQFQIHGKTHYGWVRGTVDPFKPGNFDIVLHISGYAYETIPNKPIITGKTKGPDVITVQPGTLGSLAAGRK